MQNLDYVKRNTIHIIQSSRREWQGAGNHQG